MDVLLMVQLYFASPSIKALHLNSNLYLFPITYTYLHASVVSKYLFGLLPAYLLYFEVLIYNYP